MKADPRQYFIGKEAWVSLIHLSVIISTSHQPKEGQQ